MSRPLYFGAPAHLRQDRCDRIVAKYRSEQPGDNSAPGSAIRRAGSPAPETAQRRSIRRDVAPDPALVPTDNELLVRVAEEIDYARRMLDAMGDTLINDPAVVARHATSLQSVDIIGQMLGHLAAVVRSSDQPAAVQRIGMAELKGRLTRKSLL